MNKPNFASGAGHLWVEIETRTHTRETFGQVQVAPASQNHPYLYLWGRVSIRFWVYG
jgi:hypothetical protein